ncbi:heavy-metal-associated domain-containing protein [Methylomarinum sp. Ch1-1]|uniref:Heavy-metal-associated domain-containing protein n=1 Tax=Methylomarinum roseum TaxID=3067653 RepID=A0AAU7NTM9_9GAMM|nr:heavy-metal-associated domain-containing protein [Methylomarinum sp. Ch1-1]MDP4519586.1 heavy-metal-associated domain-containing protein [Methylomarinum sp. Ch1-1]
MTESVSLTVTGMKCGGCESSVNEKVGAIEGVVSVKPMHQENRVDVEFDESKTSLDAIKQVITEAGFTVA